MLVFDRIQAGNLWRQSLVELENRLEPLVVVAEISPHPVVPVQALSFILHFRIDKEVLADMIHVVVFVEWLTLIDRLV